MTDSWPFDQDPDAAAFTVVSVLRGGPILYVSHDEDGAWQFLDGGNLAESDGRLIGMGTALALDPTLATIANLQLGWFAVREFVGRTVEVRPHT